MIVTQSEDFRVEALFVSPVQRSERPTPELIRDAVETACARLGERGCAALVAQEFGEHPDTAVGRMVWARHAIQHAYR